MDVQHRQIDVVEQLRVVLDAVAAAEEHHHLLAAILLQERVEEEQPRLRGNDAVALLQPRGRRRRLLVVDSDVERLLQGEPGEVLHLRRLREGDGRGLSGNRGEGVRNRREKEGRAWRVGWRRRAAGLRRLRGGEEHRLPLRREEPHDLPHLLLRAAKREARAGRRSVSQPRAGRCEAFAQDTDRVQRRPPCGLRGRKTRARLEPNLEHAVRLVDHEHLQALVEEALRVLQ